MKKALRSVCAIAATLVMAAMTCLPALAAGQKANITVGPSVSASGGMTVSLPIGLESVGAGSTSMTGLSLSIQYDKTKLQYVDAPAVSNVPQLGSTEVFHNAEKGLVNMAWTTGSPLSVASNTVLYTLTFRVLDAAQGNTDIRVTVNELYAGTGMQLEDITLGSKTVSKTVHCGEADSMVQAVIDAINAVGKVEYTDECLEKINQAAYRYSLLNLSQKELVTNYQTLLDAQVEYGRLKYEASQKPVDEEVSRYLEAHQGILSKAVEDVQLTDEAAVNAAYDAFQKLSAAAKNEIFSYNAKLKNMKTRIEALKQAEEDRQEAEEEERRLRQEAQDYADGFRKENNVLLHLSMDDLLPDHHAGITQALSTLNMLTGLNPYVSDLLSAERILLENMLDKVEELIQQKADENTPDKLSAERFRSSNSWLLSQTVDTITAQDKMDILVALEVYGVLEPGAQELLTEEYALLNQLLEKAAQLEALEEDKIPEPTPTQPAVPVEPEPEPADPTAPTDSGTQSTEPETPPTQPTQDEIPVVPGGDGNTPASGSVTGRSSLAVPIAALVFVVCFLLFEGLQAYYHLVVKKKAVK